MNKCIRMFTLFTAFVILLTAASMASADPVIGYKITHFAPPAGVYGAEEGKEVTVTFDIVVTATAFADDAAVTAAGFFKNANLLKWTVGDADMNNESEYFKVITSELKNNGVSDADANNTSEYVLSSGGGALAEGSSSTFTLTIKVTGKLKTTEGSVKVKASLWQKEGGSAAFTIGESTSTSGADLADGSEDESEEFVITEEKEMDPHGDPTNAETWDGKDPKYKGKGTAGPKSGKPSLKTSTVDFKSGTFEAKDIEIKGAAPSEVDVYIAAKDTVKLFGINKTKAEDIHLTKENIIANNLPFRISSYDITSEDSKTATSKLTLAYNGAEVAYKGFPLTIKMANKNTGSKPVVKAVKINVTPNDGVPVWKYDGFETVTTSKDRELEDGAIIGTTKDSGKTITFTDADYFTWTVTIPSGDAYIILDGQTVKVSLENAPGDVTKLKVHDTRDYELPAKLEVTKQTSKTDPNALEVVAAVGEGETGILEPKTYYVYAPADKSIAPYSVTWKEPKDKGIKVDYTPPVYDKYGSIVEHATVEISGTLTEKTKETKNKITFTAANASTGKKAALSVTVIGKLAPYFDESKWVDGIMPTKYVEAGKVPSVTFKAKGSKTITYELANEGLAETLAKYNMSFDSKKGKVIAISKNDKPLPTVDEDGDFEPIELTVLAVNGVGEGAEATALVGVTGKKVKADKASPSFTVGDPKGTTQEVAMKGVAADTAGYKVIFTNPAKDKKDKDLLKLSDYGLEIVDTWSEEIVSAEATIKDGERLPDNGGYDYEKDTDKIVVSGKVKEVDPSEEAGDEYYVASGDVVILSGDQTNPDRNKLILSVADADKIINGLKNGKANKVTFKLLASNYGAETDLSVKVEFKPAASSTNNKKNKNAAEEELAVKTKTSKGGGTAYEFYYDGEAQPETKTETENEEAVVLGEPRTVAQLTAGQNAFLAEKGYKVVAVLPEVTAKVDGQQEFEVELDEDAPEGAKLIWLPFPKNAEETDDDTIADFYDAEGSDIEEVPAGKVIVVAPWLRAGVTYQPVIAVEE